MKRGFLNTQKAKKRVAEAVESEATASCSKSKDKQHNGSRPDTETVDMSNLDLDAHRGAHELPKSVQARYGDKRRVIFRIWPRVPNAKTIEPSKLQGKKAGNGLDLWGATLYDFYYVNRVPGVEYFFSIITSTGSRLAKWMRQNDELTAEHELSRADKEEDPKEIPVADMGELISYRDMCVSLGVHDRFSSRKEVREKAEKKSSLDIPQSAAAEAEDSIPQVNDQNDDAKKYTVPNARLHESMQEDETSVNSPGKAADQSAVSPLQHNESMQVDGAGQKSPETGTNKPAMSSPKDDPFHPDNYPSPWPFIPCSNDDPPPPLQQRIPLHLLPQKLHVHDPWNCLSINEGGNDYESSWLTKVTEGGDIVRTYSLSLSKEGKQTASASKEEARLAKDEPEAAGVRAVMHIFPDEKEDPADKPLIEVILPSQPQKRTHLEEAHLYIRPPEIGEGNHSVVYLAEWELPRDLFAKPKLCRICVEEDARKQFQALKDQGKWEELLKGLTEKAEVAQASGKDKPSELGSSHALPKGTAGITIKEHSLPHEIVSVIDGLLSKHRRKTGDEKTADESAAEADPVTSTASHVMETGGIEVGIKMDDVDEQHVELGDQGCSETPGTEEIGPGKGKGKGKETLKQDENGEVAGEEEKGERDENISTIQPPTVFRLASYPGPVVRIYSNMKWQDSLGTRCKHARASFPDAVPRTATVNVVAKLSIEDDAHLERESRNYQKFPSHFFEHWNGYNVVPPLLDPVPVGALCPQFYGYYTPDDPTDGKKVDHYLSPILLLEHCGSEVVLEELDQDDRQECASLLLRFHHAGWLHYSFAERNILCQIGKPTEWPIERRHIKSKSFRLIDFGRSKLLPNSADRMEEETIGLQLFHLRFQDPNWRYMRAL